MTYNHITFSTVGANIPHMELTEDQKDVIKIAIEGATSGSSPLKNPVLPLINSSYSSADDMLTTANRLGYVIPPDFTGNGVEYGGLTSALENVKDSLKDSATSTTFKEHTDRISGAVLEGDGELFDFMGIQSVAKSYNGVMEALKDEDAESEDNYSIMFSSILNNGILQPLEDSLSGETGSIDPEVTGSIDSAQEEVDRLTDIVNQSIEDMSDHIQQDNENLSKAVGTMKRFGLGLSVMGMRKDTYFGARIISINAGATLASELDDILVEGPFSIAGYFPLYKTPEAARNASPTPNEARPGETTEGYHTHTLNGVVYYMPNGLGGPGSGMQFHGDYNSYGEQQTYQGEETSEDTTTSSTSTSDTSSSGDTASASTTTTTTTPSTPSSDESSSSDSSGSDSESDDDGGDDDGGGDDGGGGGYGGY